MTKAASQSAETTEATTEKAVTVYHPTLPGVARTVAADAVQSAQAAGWRKTPPKA